MMIDFGDGMEIYGFPQLFDWQSAGFSSGAAIYVSKSSATVTAARIRADVEAQPVRATLEPI